MSDKVRRTSKTPKREPIALTDTDLKGASAAAATGFFTEVSGLGSESETVAYQDGDDLFLRKRPGR